MSLKTLYLMIGSYLRLINAANPIYFTQTISQRINFTDDFVSCALGCAQLSLSVIKCDGFNYRPSKCDKMKYGCSRCTYQKNQGQAVFDFVRATTKKGTTCKEVKRFNWQTNFDCPGSGMTQFNGNCYWVGKLGGTRAQATKICQSMAGKLTSIQNYGENWFLTKLAYEKSCGLINGWFPGTMLIGGLYDAATKKITWNDGWKGDFSLFYWPNETGRALMMRADECGELNPFGFWGGIDVNSATVPKFACKSKGIVK